MIRYNCNKVYRRHTQSIIYMAKISTHPIEPILSTCERWKLGCLLGDGSLFSEADLWTLNNVNQFKSFFVDNLIEGSDQTFYEKFQIQLSEAPEKIKQLSAEMLYVLLLFPSNITARKKAEDIRLIWGWSGQSLDVAFPNLEASFAEGVGSTGMAFNNLRWAELIFFTTWLLALKTQTISERERLLSDPWTFGNWLDKTDGADRRQFRHIVLFLLFPDYFETSSSKNQKNQMLSAFKEVLGVGSSLIESGDSDGIQKDKNILLIRERLTQESGEAINFYLSPYKERWLSVAEETKEPDITEVYMRELLSTILEKYPAARTNTAFGGQHEIRSLFERLKESVASLPFIKKDSNLLVKYSYGKGNWAETAWLAILDKRETTTTQKGTYIVLLFRGDGDGCHLKLGQGVTEIIKSFGVGAAATEELQRRADEVRAMFPEMMHSAFDQTVEQSNEKRAKLTELYEASTIYSKYYKRDSIPNNKDLAEDIQTLVDCYGKYVDHRSRNDNTTDPLRTISEPELYSYEDALEDIFLSKTELVSIVETARRKKNIILQGPPGVGKTFVSKRLAYLLLGTKDLSKTEFIQFHQSYSYEDFVQGWRPNSNGGFNLKNGSFYEFCEKARKDSKNTYVFIIDEINRGNLSKIFGELLMLIEGDKRGDDNAIKLTYSESDSDRFSVPENVFLIGLMNTADRSLALVDYALRRRFAFFNLSPQFESDKFESVITVNGGSLDLVNKIRSRIGALNQVITNERRDLGPGFQVGHSYFCPAGPISSDDIWYADVINTEIMPLIEEYWFDSPEKVDTLIAQLLQ
jgi:5-methylcytosine-specific restriction protein B